MKKYLLILAAMVATLSASAQDEDDLVNEIGISYGVVANSNFLDIYTDAMTGKSGTYFGPLALEYFHHLCPMVSVGGVGVYKSHKETINGTELTNLYYTIMPAVKFSWYTSNHFGFYSKAAVGYTIFSITGEQKSTTDKEKSGSFNFQVSAVGLEVGGKRFRLFTELGWGEQGLACAGLRCKF